VPLHLTFEGETLAHILTSIRSFLDSLPGDGATQGLVNLDGPLPAAVKRAPKEGRGAPIDKAQAKAIFDAEAPPCTREEVALSARRYVNAFGGALLTAVVGYDSLTAIPDAELWRVRRDLDACVKAGKA
jgi:hypothetical protein